MQTHFLIEVSFKKTEFGGFDQSVPPVFVNKDKALAMIGQYAVFKADCGVRDGMACLYSQEHVYPFVRLLVLNNAADDDSDLRIAELLEEVPSVPQFSHLDQISMTAKSA